VFRDCSRRRSSESDLTIACTTASRARSGPRLSSIDLHVAWSAVFCTCCRRRSSEFDLALACASASRSTGSAILSVPQSFAGSNSFASPSLRASSGISRASFFCCLQITCTGQGNVLRIRLRHRLRLSAAWRRCSRDKEDMRCILFI